MGKGLERSEVLQRTVPQSEKRAKFTTAIALTMKKGQIMSSPKIPLTSDEVDRIIQMAWEDRTTFDAIRVQFQLTPGQVIELMRSNLKPGSFRLWRMRTAGRITKHLVKRSFIVGRFRCPDQRD
jgi:uncharacterized protein (TIGR03643 family)